MANGHGGARAGAGRKPGRVEPALAIIEAEQKIAARLPALVDRLLELADCDKPNLIALKYLVDRMMGRPVSVNELPPGTGWTDEELIEEARRALSVAGVQAGAPAASR